MILLWLWSLRKNTTAKNAIPLTSNEGCTKTTGMITADLNHYHCHNDVCHCIIVSYLYCVLWPFIPPFQTILFVRKPLHTVHHSRVGIMLHLLEDDVSKWIVWGILNNLFFSAHLFTYSSIFLTIRSYGLFLGLFFGLSQWSFISFDTQVSLPLTIGSSFSWYLCLSHKSPVVSVCVCVCVHFLTYYNYNIFLVHLINVLFLESTLVLESGLSPRSASSFYWKYDKPRFSHVICLLLPENHLFYFLNLSLCYLKNNKINLGIILA